MKQLELFPKKTFKRNYYVSNRKNGGTYYEDLKEAEQAARKAKKQVRYHEAQNNI